MQAFLGVLYAGMGAGQALADLGNIAKAKVACRDMFALMDRKSLVNGLELVGDMPMSLLAYTAWTSPNVWTRTAPCSATLSATPSSLASEVPAKQVWRWSVPPRQHGIAASAVPLIPKNEGQNCSEESNSEGVLASHTLHRNRWSSIRSVETGGSTVADVPCSTEAHTRFCDDHVLDGGAVSVSRVSLSTSPTAPSVQTEMGYPWDRCGMSCRVESRKVTWPQATEGVESYEHKIQNCLRKLRKTSDVEIVRRKESDIRRTDSEDVWSKRR